jgi:uncharacterized protein YegL
MPRMNDNTMQSGAVGTGLQKFEFSATKVDHLGATEYTLVTVAVDETGSTAGFEADLRKCLISAVESCKKSPRSANLLLRVVVFSTAVPNGVEEIHGFKPLSEIDPNSYRQFNPGGGTPLFDAAFSAVGATNAYAKTLAAQDFPTNGIVFVITDGDDNSSGSTISMIKQEMDRGKRGEEIESLVGVIVGINASYYRQQLDNLANGTGMKYIDAGDATKGKLAKLAEFVSQSISSQSQALGTGGPSQNIAPVI